MQQFRVPDKNRLRKPKIDNSHAKLYDWRDSVQINWHSYFS